jgi:CHAT domain-containing protein
MKTGGFIFLWLLFFVHGISAQCLDSDQIWKNLNETASLADNKEIINNLLKLEKTCRDCGRDRDSTYAKILHILGRTFWAEGDLANAAAFTRVAIRVNSLPGKDIKRMNLNASYFNLGCIYAEKGDLKNSLACFSNSIVVGKTYRERWFSVSDGYLQQANIYNQAGDYEKAIHAADFGYKFGYDIGDRERMASNLIEKSQALMGLMKWNQAEIILNDAKTLVQETANKSLLGFVYTKIADVNKHKGDYKAAIKFYTNAFQFFKKGDYRYGCAQTANDLGYLYKNNLKNYTLALKYYDIALEYNDLDFGKARVYNNIGSVYFFQKEFSKAFSYFQKALITSPIGFSNTDIRTNPSAKLISTATSKDYLLSMVQDKADTWLDFARYDKHDSKEKLQNALKTYMLADTMIDFMRWEHTGNVTKLFWRDKTRSMYEHAIETCNLLNDPVTAFYFFEKSRAVMLNDQLNELGANQQLNQKDAERERLLRQRISDLQNKLGESKPESKQYISLRNDLFHVQEEQQIFVKQLEKANPQYYAYKYDNRVPTLKEIRTKVIPDGQVLISYFVGDSAVYGLNVTANEIGLRKINIAEYKRYTQEFQRLLGNRENQNKEFGNYLMASNRLYELLLKPFGINSGRVIISPDGNFLPFESLSFSSSQPEYLVKKYAFSYTYSAGFLTKTFRSKSDLLNTKMFFGMAPGKFAPKLVQASLPGSELALETINKHFLFSKIVTGADASRKTFLTELSGHRIIQLLTHASADSSEVEPTLYFADSTLKLSELPTSGLSKTQLLVLSACRTGVGKNQKGEGVFSLARGFAGIGIPSTLTTLWSVENKAIYELTALFYDQLDKGIPLDIALQQAQIEWLATASKSDQLPYSWAGMVLVGNSEPVETGMSKGIIYAIFATTTFVLLLGGFLFRRKMATRG